MYILGQLSFHWQPEWGRHILPKAAQHLAEVLAVTGGRDLDLASAVPVDLAIILIVVAVELPTSGGA